MSKLRAALEAAKKQRDAMPAHASTSARTQASQPPPVSAAIAAEDSLSMVEARRIATDQTALKTSRILSHDTRHRAEGAYRMLRTRIMQKMRSNGWRFLGVSSIGPREGKTFTAINLAISIAAEIGQEALLLDLDLRRPSAYEYFGIDETDFKSLREYFENNPPDLGDLLVCPSIDRLGCLLSAIPMEQPSDVLASARGKRLFDELRTRLLPETVVIVDLPPLLTVDDALAVAPMIDALLFVVAEGHTKRDDLPHARELLQDFNLIGTILNKSVEKDDRRRQYYY